MRAFRLYKRPVCPQSRHRRPAQVKGQVRGHVNSLDHLPRRSAGQRSKFSLPDRPARTRFAPSPTGYLHLGSLRTALFNYLLAKATGGQFLIRVEDTDQTRFIEDAERRLYEDLKWAGITWDEGPDVGGTYGPYKQSHRLELYAQHAEILLRDDRAFRCFCSKEALELHQKAHGASGTAAQYPGTCLSIAKDESDERAARGEAHTIRFKSSPTPVAAPDLVYGRFKKAEREDHFIIIKSDGFPTYHFANVVDDHFMDITHVIRGAEWLISTPKHVELYNAFGWNPPQFAHVGLLVNMERQKLSKRDLANIGISVYREKDMLPPALLNFVVMLGWNPNLKDIPGNRKGVWTLKEMIDNFSLRFTKGDIVVDMSKLRHFQTKHTARLIQEEPTTSTELNTYILGPTEQALRRFEDIRSNEHDSVEKQYGDEGHRAFFESIGVLITHRDDQPLLHPSRDYIHGALQTSKGPYQDPESFLLDNRYLFWEISPDSLRESLDQLAGSVQNIRLRQDTISGQVHEVISFFIKELSTVSAADWTDTVLDQKVKYLAECVTFEETTMDKHSHASGGYKFLRWSLLNSMSGSKIVAAMQLLGKEGTLKRLSEARDIASSLDN